MTAPLRYAPGQRLDAERANFSEWADYSVEWTAATTNPVLNNGTLVGKYRWLDPKVVFFWVRLVPGSSTTYGSGQYRFSLPVPAAQGGPDPALSGSALQGGALYRLVGWVSVQSGPATYINLYRGNVNTQENLNIWSATSPVALASGHTVSISGWYVAAL